MNSQSQSGSAQWTSSERKELYGMVDILVKEVKKMTTANRDLQKKLEKKDEELQAEKTKNAEYGEKHRSMLDCLNEKIQRIDEMAEEKNKLKADNEKLAKALADGEELITSLYQNLFSAVEEKKKLLKKSRDFEAEHEHFREALKLKEEEQTAHVNGPNFNPESNVATALVPEEMPLTFYEIYSSYKKFFMLWKPFGQATPCTECLQFFPSEEGIVLLKNMQRYNRIERERVVLKMSRSLEESEEEKSCVHLGPTPILRARYDPSGNVIEAFRIRFTLEQNRFLAVFERMRNETVYYMPWTI